jgi:uncharacterized cupredoxin-like copper-binding protein
MKIKKEYIQMKSLVKTHQVKTSMKSTTRSLFLAAITVLIALILVACGGGQKEAAQHSSGEHSVSVAQAGSPPSSSAGEADTTVNVVARDFEFILDSNSAAAGTISFVITNEGAMPHDFAITIDGERYKSEMIKPGSSGSLTVELPAGNYEYICTIPGHDVLGMKGTFTVN